MGARFCTPVHTGTGAHLASSIAGMHPQFPRHFPPQPSPRALLVSLSTNLRQEQLLRKQTNTGTSTILTAIAPRSTRTRLAPTLPACNISPAQVTCAQSLRLYGISPAILWIPGLSSRVLTRRGVSFTTHSHLDPRLKKE